MKNKILLIFLCIPFFASAQMSQINWQDGLSWVEVLQKAKTEGKNIFIDCYATWCIPCHKMDAETYTSETIANIMNEKFINIRLQMDKTSIDKEQVKKWYRDAESIQKLYSVSIFPTFLFFDTSGNPIHKDVGFKDIDGFKRLINDAQNPDKQYYALLKNYKRGTFPINELKGLARSLKFSDFQIASKIAAEYLSKISNSKLGEQDNIQLMQEFSKSIEIQNIAVSYISAISTTEFYKEDKLKLIKTFSASPKVKVRVVNYLRSLSGKFTPSALRLLTIYKNDPVALDLGQKYIKLLKPKKFFSKTDLLFIGDFTRRYGHIGFEIFLKNQSKIDAIVGQKDYAKNVVKWVIDNEEVAAHLNVSEKNGEINWKEITNAIAKKFGSIIAYEVVLDAKVRFYKFQSNRYNRKWSEYIDSYIAKIEHFGTDTTSQFVDATQLNNFVYETIFFHSNDAKHINVGLRWMEGVIRRNPRDVNNIDTYANLLYKSGLKADAIIWQKKAIRIAINDKADEFMLASLNENLKKMKSGIPTWIKEDEKYD